MDDNEIDWPGVIEVPLGDGVRPLRFRRILAGGESGSFRMGQRGEMSREEPVHRVTVEGPLYFAEVPVTQAQFEVWTGTEDYQRWFQENEELIKRTSWESGAEVHTNGFPGNPDHPAEKVTWWEARRFGTWLGEAGFVNVPGLAATLPREEEWEYACRAGTETDYSFGDGEAGLDEVAWYRDNSESKSHKVGEKKPNNLDLFDMHGNVLEWCLDLFEEGRYRLQLEGESEGGAPTMEAEEGDRVIRGGSWIYVAGGCRSASRDWCRPGERGRHYGFRLALVPGPASQDKGPEARQEAEPKAGGKPRRIEAQRRQPATSCPDRGERSEANDESVPEAAGGASAWEELKGPKRPLEE